MKKLIIALALVSGSVSAMTPQEYEAAVESEYASIMNLAKEHCERSKKIMDIFIKDTGIKTSVSVESYNNCTKIMKLVGDVSKLKGKVEAKAP